MRAIAILASMLSDKQIIELLEDLTREYNKATSDKERQEIFKRLAVASQIILVSMSLEEKSYEGMEKWLRNYESNESKLDLFKLDKNQN